MNSAASQPDHQTGPLSRAGSCLRRLKSPREPIVGTIESNTPLRAGPVAVRYRGRTVQMTDLLDAGLIERGKHPPLSRSALRRLLEHRSIRAHSILY